MTSLHNLLQDRIMGMFIHSSPMVLGWCWRWHSDSFYAAYPGLLNNVHVAGSSMEGGERYTKKSLPDPCYVLYARHNFFFVFVFSPG